MNYIFIDTVLQVYESDGNLHLICGVSNGETDVRGKDVIEKNLHLTIPMAKASRIIPDIASALPSVRMVEEGPASSRSMEHEAARDENEFEGHGMHFTI